MKIHHYTFKNIFLSFSTKVSGNFRGNSNAPDLGIKKLMVHPKGNKFWT